jgi:hypothetical protein
MLANPRQYYDSLTKCENHAESTRTEYPTFMTQFHYARSMSASGWKTSVEIGDTANKGDSQSWFGNGTRQRATSDFDRYTEKLGSNLGPIAAENHAFRSY